jgi:hypothetical protein
MSTRARAGVAALAGCAALLAAAPALADYRPSLVVSSSTSAYRASGTTTIRIAQADGDEPTALVDVRVPAGFGMNLSQPLGSVIGSADAQAKRESDGAELHLTGTIQVDDPERYTVEAAACTGEQVHDAVWLVTLGAIRVPVFVDGPPVGRLRLCLPEPAAPGFGVRLLRTALSLNGVFSNPRAKGEYRWGGIFTPHGGAGPVQSQTIVRLPPRLTLRRKVIVIRRSGRVRQAYVRLTGVVSTGGTGVRGVRVEVLSGPAPGLLTRLGFTTSFARGRFTLVTRLSARTVFQARVAAAARDAPTGQCVPLAADPAIPCVSVFLSSFGTVSKRITVRRPAR